MIDPKEIVMAVDVLDKADTASWTEAGLPTVEAVRRLTGNDTVTAEDIATALAPPKGEANASTETGGAPPVKQADASAVKAAPTINLGTAQPPAVKTLSAETTQPPAPANVPPPAQPPLAAAVQSHDDGDKPEAIGDADEDRAKLLAAEVEHARAAKDAVEPQIFAMERAAEELNRDLEAARLKRDELNATIEAGTETLSAAQMVKKIQKQTQERLMKQHEDQQKINAVLANSGVKTFPSALDQALSAGAKRSVVLIDGKPFQAPHPRSPEGIRSYANWVHNGARQSA